MKADVEVEKVLTQLASSMVRMLYRIEGIERVLRSMAVVGGVQELSSALESAPADAPGATPEVVAKLADDVAEIRRLLSSVTNGTALVTIVESPIR